MKPRHVTTLAAALAVLGMLVLPAAAAPPGSTDVAPLDRCIAAATARALESWVCLGGMLEYTVAPGGQSPAGAQPATVREQIAPDEVVVDDGGAKAAYIEPNHDTWCEYARTCTTELDEYHSLTKGNAAYGNSNGAIGTFDVVIKTSLNGRQPQWRVSLWHDSGPGLLFSSAVMRCTELGSWFGCGIHNIDGSSGDGIVDINSTYYKGPLVYGNRLNNAALYQARITYHFTPDGYPRYTGAALYTQAWDCRPASANCWFE